MSASSHSEPYMPVPNFRLRQAARETAAALADPTTPVRALAAVPTVAARLGIDSTRIHPKAQRYAVGAAVTGMFMSELLEGDGRDSRFRSLPRSWYSRLHPRRDPYTLFIYDMWAASKNAKHRLVGRGSRRRERVRWLASEYDRLTLESSAPLHTNEPVLTEEIFKSSEGPYEMANFVLYVAYVCSQHPDLKDASAQAWRDIAFDNANRVVIGRAASNVAAFASRPLYKVDCARMRLRRRGETYVLDTDGQFSHQPLGDDPPPSLLP